jgi:hypothetical protein
MQAEARRSGVVPEYYTFSLTVPKSRGHGACKVPFQMLLPHEWIGHMFRASPELFTTYFAGSPADAEDLIFRRATICFV